MVETVTRKTMAPLKVYCLPNEREHIAKKAHSSGLSVSRYLLKLGTGYQPQSVIDYKRVLELAKINGDLGRVGGLLKLWLTNDERVAFIGPDVIRAALVNIEERQAQMAAVMDQVIALQR